MKQSITLLVLLLLAGFTGLLAGQEKKAVPPRIVAYVEKPSAIYKVGEKIRFKVWYVRPPVKRVTDHPLKDCQILPGRKIDYRITGDGGLVQKGSITSGTKEVIIETSLPRPGFVLLTLSIGQGKNRLLRYAGAGVEPEKLRSGTQMPADFEAYWKGEIAKMRARKTTVTVREATEYITPANKKLVKIYDVTISDGKLTATGILTIPLHPGKKKLPILIGFGGASWIGATPNTIEAVYRDVMSFSMNIHGIKNFVTSSKERDALRRLPRISNYHRNYLYDREKFALHDIYLRIVRCLDYLKTRPEWNGKDLIASGPSFGGCQTIVAAALDKDVTLALAGAPACSDHEGARNNQTPGYPNLLAHYNNNKKKYTADQIQKAHENAPYFDAANMARLIKCPVVFSVGFIDTVCPPTSVYSAYNNVPGKNKSMIHGIYAAHGMSLVVGDNGAFSAGQALAYREMVGGKNLLVNGHFRYQIPKGKTRDYLPYAWQIRGKNVKSIRDGEKAAVSMTSESWIFQNVFNLQKKAGRLTIQGKFRGKGESRFRVSGIAKAPQQVLKASSPDKWSDFSFTYDVKKGSYKYGIFFLSGKDSVLEITDVSAVLQ